jgi:DNA polymerase (family 10)
MPIHNADIARIFNTLADLLEIQNANEFRVRAYRNAARTIDNQSRRLSTLLDEGEDLTKLPDIGKDLAGKIQEIVETGSLKLLEELKGDVPGELAELLGIDQLGPKRVRTLYQELEITSIEELSTAADKGKIRELKGFGKKIEKKIIRELKRYQNSEKRWKYAEVEQLLPFLIEHLKKSDDVEQIITAGSFRRRKETIGDLDILVICDDAENIMRRFVGYEDVKEVLARGETKSSVRLRGGLQVDLRAVPNQSYGAALYYFTGSKQHNIAVRKIAASKGLKINEYGVFRGEKDDERIAGESEEEVLAAVDLPWIEPELRENHGEIEAAENDQLPELVTLNDIRGDLHAHTEATDGRASLRDMVEAARDLGYSYLAITEHSQALTMAHGLDRQRLAKQIDEIDKLTDEYHGFRILKGIEVDILEDGSLDLEDEILAKLDFRVCSVHSKFNFSTKKQTERIIRAMDNKHFNILGHPSGRLINEREPYPVDMEKVIEAARERGCFLELNAHPDRLDLNDNHCRLARECGVKVAISTDAHSTQGFNNMKYGVYQARRGWLSKNDVLNTRKVSDLLKLLRR